jgi:Asp-tRNA(Asn)/Glu-tRNA(Gln) amidotransferase A subunit family amidase
VEYVHANRARLAFRDAVMPLLEEYDALLTPTAPAPAPAGLTSTGDAWFCAPWSSAGVPAITLPTALSPSGLPWAIQLVGAAGREAALLGTAAWCEAAVPFSSAPAL